MARVILKLELDGGASMRFEESSIMSIYGGGDAALLVQGVFERAVRACGLETQRPDAEPQPQESAAPAESVDTPPEPPAAKKGGVVDVAEKKGN